MDYTTNYHLPQWVKEDRIMMDDFNEAMSAIDQGIKGVDTALTEGLASVAANLGTAGKNARVAIGSYVGTGKYGKSNPNRLTFDFYPVLLICQCAQWAEHYPSIFIRNLNRGCSTVSADGPIEVTWQEKGVSWYHTVHQDSQNNSSGETYYYVVIGYDKDAEA